MSADAKLNLLVFADGTGNKGGETPDTNVFRLLNAVDRRSENVEQRTHYDVGVGTSSFKPDGPEQTITRAATRSGCAMV